MKTNESNVYFYINYMKNERGKNFLFHKYFQNFCINFTSYHMIIDRSKAFKYPDTRSPYNTENIIEKPDIRYFKRLW